MQHNVHLGRLGFMDFWASLSLGEALGEDVFYVNAYDDQEAIQIYFDVYKHYFNTSMVMEFTDYHPLTIEQENKLKPDGVKWFELLQRNLKPFKCDKKGVTYSIIPYEVCQDKGIPFNITSKDGIDVGDSRNFKSKEEMIEKIEIVKNSEYFLGPSCSWMSIARLFGTKTYIVIESHETI